MARNFNGSSDILTNSNAPITAVPLTMGCWIRPASLTTANRVFSISSTTGANNSRFAIAVRGDMANDPLQAIATNSAATNGTAQILSVLAVGVWSHVVARFETNASRYVFHNGVKSTQNTTNTTPSALDLTEIGAGSLAGGAPTGFWPGDIAEPFMYNVSLTDEEIRALASGNLPSRIRRESLKHYPPILGADPEPDYSGGGFHMTVTGTTVVPHPPVSMMF